MAASVDLSRVIFIVMREMRGPLIALVCVYSLSILGMVFIPGLELDGEVQYMSIFHAFYFMTYTATTTGFGEIPMEFSNAQRFWAILCLYLSVLTWLYAISSIVILLQNPFLLSAFSEWRFSRRVQRLKDPFVIICGFGDTGSVLTRGLSDNGLPAVIIDSSLQRIKAVRLRDYSVAMPAFCGDACVPKHLLEAGLQRSNCRAIIAITNSDFKKTMTADQCEYLTIASESVCSPKRPHFQSCYLKGPILPLPQHLLSNVGNEIPEKVDMDHMTMNAAIILNLGLRNIETNGRSDNRPDAGRGHTRRDMGGHGRKQISSMKRRAHF